MPLKKKIIFTERDLKNIYNQEVKIIFLNNWYYLNFKKNIKNLKYEVLKHYSYTSNEQHYHHLQCEQIYEKVILELGVEFNKLHNLNYSNKSIKLLFGPWLRKFIHICYDRYLTINNIFKLEKNFEKNYILDLEKFNLTTEDCVGIFNCSTDETWNHILVSKLILFFKLTDNFLIDKIDDNYQFKSNNPFKKETNIRISILGKILKVFKFFKRKKVNFLIFKSYLPFLQEKKLEILMGEAPNVWNFYYDLKKNFNLKLRNKLSFKRSNEKNLENFIKYLLPFSIPLSLIENFNSLRNKTFKFPQNPNYILSATAFEMNTLFKIYSAEQLEKKTKLLSVQHGAGSSLNPQSAFLNDYEFCSNYFTWGHKNHEKDIPMFNVKTNNRNLKFNEKGFLNIVSRSFGHNNSLFDRQLENLNILDFLKFVPQELDPKILQNTVLRLHPSNLDKENEHEFLRQEFLKLNSYQKNKYQKNFLTITKKSRLSLFVYNSTGILENLSVNFPTVCYWKEGYNQVNKDLYHKFQLLEEAKIFFLNKNSLINHINNIWNNINSWWFAKETQKKINDFNYKLNFPPPHNSLEMLAAKFKEVSNINIK